MATYAIVNAILTNIKGLKYKNDEKRYVLDDQYVNSALNITLETIYKGKTVQSGKKNAKEILDRISRQFYNYEYGNEKMWPEDYLKKQYLLLTVEDTVRVTRDIMISHLESVVLTRRDLLLLEHGVDLDGMKLIEDFDKNMEKYRFSTDTRDIFNRDRTLRYKERLTNRDIDPSLIGAGY